MQETHIPWMEQSDLTVLLHCYGKHKLWRVLQISFDHIEPVWFLIKKKCLITVAADMH